MREYDRTRIEQTKQADLIERGFRPNPVSRRHSSEATTLLATATCFCFRYCFVLFFFVALRCVVMFVFVCVGNSGANKVGWALDQLAN